MPPRIWPAPGWKPLLLDEHQNETLIILSDLIIPATDTPGAKEALVNRYIDLVLAADTHGKPARVPEFASAIWTAKACAATKPRSATWPREDQDDLLHAMAYPERRQRMDRRGQQQPTPVTRTSNN